MRWIIIAITNIKTVIIKNCIVDEIHIRKSTNSSVNLTSLRDLWQTDTYLLAKFKGNLEAGNVTNSGIPIDNYIIKRRRTSELVPTSLGILDYSDSQIIKFIDYTQANDEYVYSIVPVGINGLEGQPNDVSIISDFTGWILVDKDTNAVLPFDKFLGDSEPTVETQLNQGRTEIQTFSRFPSVYYSELSYHTFSLSTVLIPSEFEKSGQSFETIINTFVNSHKPFLVKSGDGRIFICDVNSPKFSTPLNVWINRDYGVLTLNFVEVDTVDSYMVSLATKHYVSIQEPISSWNDLESLNLSWSQMDSLSWNELFL